MSDIEDDDDDLETEVELSESDEEAENDADEDGDWPFEDEDEDADDEDEEDDADDEDEDEDGEVIDGSEDDISNLENADPDDDEDDDLDSDIGVETRNPAVDAAVRAVQQAAANKKRNIPMADAKKMTKADAIRTTIAKMKADGKTDIRPKDVIAALAKRGITVTSPQVSVTLTNWDKQSAKTPAVPAPKAPTAKVAKPVAAAPKEDKRALAKVRSTAPATPAAEGRGPEYHALMATGDFVRTVGGVNAARELLDAYEQLLDTAG
jgi:hypothetical protein